MHRLVNEIAGLVAKGWRPYQGQVRPDVYRDLKCHLVPEKEEKTKRRERPHWFVRGDIYLCIGCPRKCCLSRPTGFQPMLPILYRDLPGEPFSLTPQEMVARRHSLTIREAAYCLNVSESLIYRYVYEGRLTRMRERPVRVRAADVAAMMDDFEE